MGWSQVTVRKGQGRCRWLGPLLLLGGVSWGQGAFAQSIIPALDGTGTSLTINGNQWNIGGGQLSADQLNLFHSFEQFGVAPNQIANFLANPQVQNILARVVGGDPSVINGLLQVSGGSANLYLMNPAGILFGPNASLNVPAAFNATTATGIGFGSNWFSATGPNSYSALVGQPTQFAFGVLQPGSIVNAASLTVGLGQSITLIGGTVINTGQLNAPGGQITLLGMPGSQVVQLNQPGSPLTLEIQPFATAPTTPQPFTLPVAQLPQLLSGGGGNATGVTVNAAGEVVLSGSGIAIPTNAQGTTLVSGSLNTAGNTGGAIALLGQQVGVINGTVNASGTSGGGTILVGGDVQGQGRVPNAQQTYVNAGSTLLADAQLVGNGGQVIVWANDRTVFQGAIAARGGAQGGNGGFSEVSGKQILLFQGGVDLTAVQGQAGRLLLDPTDLVIDQSNQSYFENVPGSMNLDIQATGRILIRNLISKTLNPNSPSVPALDFQPGTGQINFIAGLDFQMDAGTVLRAIGRPVSISASSIQASTLSTVDLAGNGGAIQLTANTGSVTLSGNIGTFSKAGAGGLVHIKAAGNITTGSAGGGISGLTAVSIETFGPTGSGDIILESLAGGIDTTAGNLNASGSTGNPGNISLTAFNNITTADIISRGEQASLFGSGNITLTSTNGSILIISAPGGNSASIDAFAPNNNSGAIQLDAYQDIVVQGIIQADVSNGSGGSITLNSQQGNINIAGRIGSSVNNTTTVNGSAGDITITAFGNITTNDIVTDFLANSSAIQGNAGAVKLTSTNGSINTAAGGNGILSFSTNGSAGDVILNAATGIATSVINANSSNQSSIPGNAGKIALTTSQGDITTGLLDTSFTGSTGGQAGSIQLQTQTGAITTTNVSATSNTQGVGGDITLQAFTTLTTGSIDASGGAGSGALQFNGQTINFTGGVGSVRSRGNAFSLQPQTATQNLLLGGAGGAIANTLVFPDASLTALASDFSSLTFGRPDSTAQVTINTGGVTFNVPVTLQTSAAGAIAINGPFNTTGNTPVTLTTGTLFLNANLTTNGQAITVNGNTVLGSNNLTVGTGGQPGTIAFRGLIDSQPGTAFALTLNPGGGTLQLGNTVGGTNRLQSLTFSNVGSLQVSGGVNVTSGDIQVRSLLLTGNAIFSTLNGNIVFADDVTSQAGITSSLTAIATTGNVAVRNITTGSANGVGGSISLQAPNGTVLAGNLNSSGLTGGELVIIARDSITAGVLNASGSLGNGGNVTLDPLNDIQVTSINAQGGPAGVGGNVDITTGRFFLATGSFLDQNGLDASISTARGLGGGSITIRHNGGDLFQPFNVFNPFPNGTLGVLTTGLGNIIRVPNVFPGSYTQQNIRIITSDRYSLALADAARPKIEPVELPDDAETKVFPLEEFFTREFEQYFAQRGLVPPTVATPKTLEQIREILSRIEAETLGARPVLVYGIFVDARTVEGQVLETVPERNRPPQSSDQLEMVLVTAQGKPLPVRVATMTRQRMKALVEKFRDEDIVKPGKEGDADNQYRNSGLEIYQSVLPPRLRTALQERGVNHLTFIVDTDLRSIPFAALYNGRQHLIEEYPIGVMPSLSLTNAFFSRNLNRAELLAMGTEKFQDLKDEANPTTVTTVSAPEPGGITIREQRPEDEIAPEAPRSLPLALKEVAMLKEVWQPSQMLVGENFTIANLDSWYKTQNSRIIHLATHGSFDSNPLRSHIRFLWQALKLSDLGKRQWDKLPVDLLVLSACETALGDRNSEFGFVGVATQAGVRTSVGTLWDVKDLASLAFMMEFYWQLQQVESQPPLRIKTKALQQTALNMMRGKVKLVNRTLIYSGKPITLSVELQHKLNLGSGTVFFQHPYFWSAYTMIGSPW